MINRCAVGAIATIGFRCQRAERRPSRPTPLRKTCSASRIRSSFGNRIRLKAALEGGLHPAKPHDAQSAPPAGALLCRSPSTSVPKVRELSLRNRPVSRASRASSTTRSERVCARRERRWTKRTKLRLESGGERSTLAIGRSPTSRNGRREANTPPRRRVLGEPQSWSAQCLIVSAMRSLLCLLPRGGSLVFRPTLRSRQVGFVAWCV